jgi:hypothetical protein
VSAEIDGLDPAVRAAAFPIAERPVVPLGRRYGKMSMHGYARRDST